MLLRKSISNTKRFFQNAVQGFKSLLSGGYERLPKTPPFNPFSCGGGEASLHQSFRELDNFYTDFSNRWDSDKDKAKKRSSKKKMVPMKQPLKEEDVYEGSFMKFVKQSSVKSRQEHMKEKNEKKMRSSHEEEEESSGEYCSSMVAQKLKELEMMDASNVDHVLDIEEVIHYYSRLTCPAYLDIVNRFFMEMCSEFFHPQASNGKSCARSRPK